MQRAHSGIIVGLLCAACGSGDDPGVAVALTRDAGSDMNMGQTPVVDAGAQVQDAAPPPVTPPLVVTDAGSGETACHVQVVNPVKSIPDMLIVLDRSGSMNPGQNDQGTDRWGGSRTALMEVTKLFDDSVSFGLMTYPGGPTMDRNRDECSAGALDVPVASHAAPAIGMALEGMSAGGRTPTAATLQAALSVLGAVMTGPDQAAVGKYVLLVTDGDPNCSGMTRDNVDTTARTQSIAAVDALRMAGIKTFVVGYETAGTDFAGQLDSMAAAGGTGATMHRSVTTGADLSSTIAEIAGKVASCTYALDEEPPNPMRVLVEVDKTKRDLGNEADGWRLEADKRTVTLLGKACTDIRAGKLLTMTVLCEDIPLR